MESRLDSQIRELTIKYEEYFIFVKKCVEETAKTHKVTPKKVVKLIRRDIVKNLRTINLASCERLYKIGNMKVASKIARRLLADGKLYIKPKKGRFFINDQLIDKMVNTARGKRENLAYLAYLGDELKSSWKTVKSFCLIFKNVHGSKLFEPAILELDPKEDLFAKFEDVTEKYIDYKKWFHKLLMYAALNQEDDRIFFPDRMTTLKGDIASSKVLTSNTPQLAIINKRTKGGKLQKDLRRLVTFLEDVKLATDDPYRFLGRHWAEELYYEQRYWMNKPRFNIPNPKPFPYTEKEKKREKARNEAKERQRKEWEEREYKPSTEHLPGWKCRELMGKFGIKNKKDLKLWMFKRHPDRTENLPADIRNKFEEEVKVYYVDMSKCAEKGYFSGE